MYLKKLEKIIEETPVVFVNAIVLKDFRTNQNYTTEGMSVTKYKGDKSILKYVVLDYTCDNLGETLTHEFLHHYFPNSKEKLIEDMTELFWKNGKFKKLILKRLISELDKCKL